MNTDVRAMKDSTKEDIQGRPSKRSKNMDNVGDHCIVCAQRKIEKRTKTLCQACNVALLIVKIVLQLRIHTVKNKLYFQLFII